ncbi:hypothetical protein CVT24_006956 [Panaeolus cyanescens]|uniref:BTB domain-containing protein n=1 Tax=Panaeolus cyanescens TaxID=181874 RepID=A0A409W033_9AGAR|nr:hypothetical protein CVT24_006956 [Panaeolus cyanescens]
MAVESVDPPSPPTIKITLVEEPKGVKDVNAISQPPPVSENNASPRSSKKRRKISSDVLMMKRHKQYYMHTGNIVIQVENTLFRLDLSVLHEHSPVLRNVIPPIQSGSLPIVGFNDRRPLVLREIAEPDFTCLLSFLWPLEEDPSSPPLTIDQLVAVLRLATSFQMTRILAQAQIKLHSLPIDPIRKIAIWDEFHLDQELLLPAYATLTQRSEPLTLTMTMSLGIRNFTKIAMCRDLYRQRVGCCGCRKSLSREESQRVAEHIARLVFFESKKSEMKESNVANKPLL